jgi:N-methylhydantoinase A
VQPTITDAYLLAGYIDPAHFLGGRMRLDRDAATAALAAIGARLGYAGADAAVRAADAALRGCSAMMATELFKGLARRGADPRDFALMAFGGAGPTHGVLLAEEARLRSVVVPPASATFCAMGAILADVKRDYVRSQQLKLSDASGVARIGAILAELEDEASQWIGREGALLGELEAKVRGMERALDARLDRARVRLERLTRRVADPRRALGRGRQRLFALDAALTQRMRRKQGRARDQLVAQQARHGHEVGSWFLPDPDTAPGGRLAHTALALLTLEVYDRLLPLYRLEAVELGF